MDKKSHLLSSLKKQVIALKSQLEGLEKTKHTKLSCSSQNPAHNKSISHSSRFDSLTLDSSYLHRGIRKFPLADSKFRNITEVIQDKSIPNRTPKFSSQRQAENLKTKQNFCSDVPEQLRVRSKSPNPLTGEGYVQRKCGIKTGFDGGKSVVERNSEKKHFHLYY